MTSRERGEAMAAVLLDETVERHGLMCWPGTAHVAAAIALAVDAAVAERDDRWTRAVGMSLGAAEWLASVPPAMVYNAPEPA